MQDKLYSSIIVMQIPNYVQNILDILEEYGFEAYIVGGCVRDSLLGLKPKDWDITSNATPTQIQHIFNNATNKMHFCIISIGLAYGTLGIIHRNSKKIVEITTYRTDGTYRDGRRPDFIQFATTIKEDLSRRDFTINALACKKIKKEALSSEIIRNLIPFSHKDLDLNFSTQFKLSSNNSCFMQLIDYHNGILHLQTHSIVCVGEAEQRFLEDSLRIMRAIRFSAVLPFAFTLHSETKEALHKFTKRLNCIAKERIRIELTKLLCGQYAYKTLPIYQDIILFILPILKHLTQKQLQYNYKSISFAPKNAILNLVLLCCPMPYAKNIYKNQSSINNYIQQYQYICKQLRFDNKSIQLGSTLLKLICNKTILTTNNSKIALKHLLSKYDIQIVWQLMAIYTILQKTHEVFVTETMDNDKNSVIYTPYTTIKLHELTHNLISIISRKECYKLSQLAINGNILQNIAKSMEISLQGKHIGMLLSNLLQDVIENKIPNEISTLTVQAKNYIIKLQNNI